MQASFFCTNSYLSAEAFKHQGWPTPPALFRAEVGQRSLEVALAQAQQADEWGFDWVSCSEHHYTPLLQTPNACVFAAALSRMVRRAKIAVLGPLVSMNNPVRIAEELAMLDQLSGGRLVVLFLRGTPNEFLAYGVNPDETRARTQEASALITRALTEAQPFGWQGRYYRFRTVSVWPGPVQRPHPPLYYSGNSLESASFAAAQHLGLGVSFYPAHVTAQMTSHYKQECAQHGWEPSPDQLLYRCFMAVGEDDKEADALQAKFFVGDPTGDLFRGRGAAVPPPTQTQAGFGLGELRFCGSPDTVVQQITDFHEATGVGVIDVAFGGAGLTLEESARSMRLFATEVLPRIRHIGVRVRPQPENVVTAVGAVQQMAARGEQMSSTTQRAEESAVIFTEHVIQVGRIRIRYWEAGQGSPVVVLQSAERLMPSPFQTLLARQFRVIALEIPSLGPPREERSLAPRDVARTLAQAADILGLERYVLVSSSTGAPLALWQALYAAEHVEALVLLSPPALLPTGQSAENGSIHDAELEHRLAEVRVATLVLLGTNDQSIPLETGRTYAERLSDCYYLLVYDAGHAMETERPEALCEAVCDFVERRGAFIVERKNTTLNP